MQILQRNGRPLPALAQPLPVNPAEAPRKNEWWLADLAARLGCTSGTVREWLGEGLLTGRQETRHPHRWIPRDTPETITQLEEYSAKARGCTTRAHPRFADELDDDTPVQSA